MLPCDQGTLRGCLSTPPLEQGPRDAEPVVGVFELGRNAGSRCGAAHFDVMPPGTTPRSTPGPVGGASGIFLGRVPVIVRGVPICTPCVNFVSQIVKPVRTWRLQPLRLVTV